MTADIIIAAQILADILVAENDALSRHDLRSASILLKQKERAILDFEMAQRLLDTSVDVELLQKALTIGDTLRVLVQENGELLSQGMRVQSQVVDMVAQAARLQARGNRSSARYSAAGRPKSDRDDVYALVARA